MLPTEADGPAERAERHEAVERSREALATLKPQELRALEPARRGLLLPRDRRDHRLSRDQGEPLDRRGTRALPPLPRPPRGRRPLRRAGAAPLRLRRRRGRGGGRRDPARAPPHLPPLPRDVARLPRGAGGGGRPPPGAAAGPRHPRRPPPRRLRRPRHPGRRRLGRLRLDPRRDRGERRQPRRRDGGARQGAGDLRRDGRRGRRLRRHRGGPGAADRPARTPRARGEGRPPPAPQPRTRRTESADRIRTGAAGGRIRTGTATAGNARVHEGEKKAQEAGAKAATERAPPNPTAERKRRGRIRRTATRAGRNDELLDSAGGGASGSSSSGSAAGEFGP